MRCLLSRQGTAAGHQLTARLMTVVLRCPSPQQNETPQLLLQMHWLARVHSESSQNFHCGCLIQSQSRAPAPCSLLLSLFLQIQPFAQPLSKSSHEFHCSCLMQCQPRAHAHFSLQMSVQPSSMQLLHMSRPASAKQASLSHRPAVSAWSAGRLRQISYSSLADTCVPAQAVLSSSCTAVSLVPCAGLA